MNPAENNFADDDWFVRVAGKEYGPVDLDTLLEWKAEGRLIRENEVRRASDATWLPAGDVPDLFAAPPPLPSEPESLFRRRTLGEIISGAFAVYRRGFGTFLSLTLLFGAASLGLKVSLAFVRLRADTGFSGTPPLAIVMSLLLMPIALVAWVIFVAGIQYATADVVAGRVPTFLRVLQRVREGWTRVVRTGLVVYGSYALWILLPLMALSIIAGGQPSVASLLIAMLALSFLAFMIGRLWINFLFWQQACTLRELDVADSLRESRDVARSGVTAPRWERPLYRGAILASLWLLAMLAWNVAIQLPFLLVRLRGVTSVEQVQALTEQMLNAPAPDGMMLAAYVLTALVDALFRPLLGIAFVLLYFDAKAR